MFRLLFVLLATALLGIAVPAPLAQADASAQGLGAAAVEGGAGSLQSAESPETSLAVLIRRCLVGKTAAGGGEAPCPTGKAMPPAAAGAGRGSGSGVNAARAEAWPPGIEPEPPRSPPRPFRI